MIETYEIYLGENATEEYLFDLENIPVEIFEKRKEEIYNIVQSYSWRLLTDKLKNEIKNKILNLIKQDIRKYKLEILN
jgi:hypothetical protein